MISEKQITHHLELLGLYRYNEELNSLAEEVSVRVTNTLSPSFDSSKPRLARSKSLLKPSIATPFPKTMSLLVDMGGTKTGVLLREVTEKKQVLWHSIWSGKNNLLNYELRGDSFESYIEDILRKVDREKALRNIDNIEATGWTWSNGGIAQAIPSGSLPKGIDIIIEGRSHYSKNEPYIKDLSDGINIGGVIRGLLKEHGYSPKVFHMGNDTVYCALAYPGAQAGMIASTGANATLIDSDGCYWNPEMGVNILLDERFLSKPEMLILGKIPLEAPMSGMQFPKLFLINLKELSKNQNLFGRDLTLIADKVEREIEAGKFANSDLSSWAPDELKNLPEEIQRIKLILEERLQFPVTRNALLVIQKLLEALIQRAAALGAVMIYGSLISLREDSNWDQNHPRIIALDSSMQRGYPQFLPLMKLKVEMLLGKEKPIDIIHMSPLFDGSVSIPALGMGRVSDQFLQSI